jgi:hypothetical protein
VLLAGGASDELSGPDRTLFKTMKKLHRDPLGTQAAVVTGSQAFKGIHP